MTRIGRWLAVGRQRRLRDIVTWPAPWGSEFGVFLDPDYARGFERRDHPSQRWTPLDPQRRSLARERGLILPAGFVERGFHERCEEEDAEAPDGLMVHEREVWMIREPLPGADETTGASIDRPSDAG